MQNQIFNSVAGKVSTGSPLITAPANSCEDALNVVFPQQGSACTRQGHSVYGPIDAEVDNVTRRPGLNPTVTDWGFISQYPLPDARYGARYNSWRTRHQYKIFNVNQSTNITGVLSSKPVLPGLKVDRSSAYGTYNPAEGFTDAIISVDPTTGTGMLGWVGNNGVTEGFTNSNESGSIRTDLCKRLDTTVVGYLDDFDVGYGQLFTKDWTSGFFDSCVTVQDYRFVDLGQNRLVMADSNKWLRATQPADLLPTYDVTTIPPQDPTNPLNIGSFGVGALPARVWMESPRIKVGIGALCSRYEPDRSGWLQEGYAVDVFVVVKTVDETGNIVYGPPSIIQTCKNYTNGLASVLVSPVLLETVLPYCSVNSVVEVYRTKQYKHYGLNMEVAPTVFYLCSSVALNTLSNINGDVRYGLQPVGWTITGGPVVSEDATHPLSSKVYNNTDTIVYSTTYTAGGKNLILSTTLGMSCQTNTNALSSTVTTVTLYNGSANTSAVYCRNPQQVYSVQLPSQTVGSAAEAVYVSYATNISVPDLARLPILKFSEPKLYSAISLSNVDSSLIDIWTQGVEGVDLDTFPLVGGTVTSRARIIGYNAVLPPTTVLNNTTIPNSSSVHRIDNTLVLGASSTYRSLLLDKRAYQIIDENAYTDCEFFPKNEPKEYFKSGAFSVLSPFSWSNQLTLHTPTIYGQTPIQQTIDTFNYVSGANPTLTLSLASMPTEDFTSIPTTGIVLLWWAIDGDLGDNWNLLDMLTYSGGAVVSMGAVYQNITFSEILSQHSGSYSGTPLSIIVAATIVSGSGINTVPVWMSQYKKALGTCVTAFAGKGYQLPYVQNTEDPTGFVSRINTGELVEGSCTSTLYGAGAIPTVDGLYFRSVSYKADTYGQNMTEGLNLFSNNLALNSPDSVVYSTTNPLQIQLKKEYYGNTGAGIGLVNKTKEITLGLDQYSYGTSQVFDTTLIQAPNTFPDLTAISTHVPNGVVFSKPNRYDVCEPLGNLLKIGDDNKPITNIVDFNGALYVFKEEEGIYRLLVDESNTFASSVTLIDNTHWMVSNKSVQLVMDGLYFVSNRGISILTSSESIQDISDPIQQEVSSYIASVAANTDLGTHPQERLAKIASYANEARRLYAAHFPRCGEHKRGVTLLYSGNTGQWSKTDQRFEAAWTVQDKTYTVEPIYTVDGQGDDTMVREATLFKKDNGTYDLYAEADQHDGKFLTSAIVLDHYAGPGPQENPVYKYDPILGQIDIQDATTRPHVDGRSITNFYNTNKNKFVYVDLFGVQVKATITLKSAGVLLAQLTELPYPAYPVALNPDPSAPMTVGIASEMVFNAYFATEGRGKARFLEGSVLSRGSCTGVGLAFRTSITSTWPSVNAIGTTAEVFRAFIPREACVGRWVQMKMRHDTPLEFIKPYGISYVFRPFEQQEKSTRNRERV